MSIDPFQDYSFEEQRKLDLRDLFSRGWRDEQGKMRPEIQGVGLAAAAIQAEEDGVPLAMVGRIVTTAFELSLNQAQTYPDDLVEELEKRNHPDLAGLIRLGLAACRDEADYRTFAQWLRLLHEMMRLRSRRI